MSKTYKLKRIHAQRLLKLAKFLRERVPERDYRQNVFIDRDAAGHRHRKASLRCQTPACALGWATAIFPLRMNRFGNITEVGAPKTTHVNETVKTFFGVKLQNARTLFFTSALRTASREATLIEHFVRSHT